MGRFEQDLGGSLYPARRVTEVKFLGWVFQAVARRGGRRRRAGRLGDRVLFALCALAGLIVAFVVVDVAYQMVNNARPSISRYGLGFLGHQTLGAEFERVRRGRPDLRHGRQLGDCAGVRDAARASRSAFT